MRVVLWDSCQLIGRGIFILIKKRKKVYKLTIVYYNCYAREIPILAWSDNTKQIHSAGLQPNDVSFHFKFLMHFVKTTALTFITHPVTKDHNKLQQFLISDRCN